MLMIFITLVTVLYAADAVLSAVLVLTALLPSATT